METPRRTETNVASSPRPNAAVAELLASQHPAAPRASSALRTSPEVRGRAVSVAPCLADALETRWQSYREQLRGCQKDFSEGTVHELRVATRRLIAQLVLLSCVIHSASLEKARRILKRRLVALGELRDTQVQRAFIADQAARFSELALMGAWLERRERRLARPAAKLVGRFKTRKLEKWVRALIHDVRAKGRGARAESRLASAALEAAANAFAEAVGRRRAIDLADLRTIHQTRVAFKRFRYMVESLSPDITGLSKRQLRELAYYQRKMGIIQDLEVLQACVARFTREDKKVETPLRPFSRYLRQRRARALRSYLKSSDRLFEFWPPASLMAASDRVATRSAA
jgi:CHAD domain-containing protein